MNTINRLSFIGFLLFSSVTAHGGCNFNTAEHLESLWTPNAINEIKIEIPKSAKWNRNFAETLTSKSENIPPELKKSFKAKVYVLYDFGVCEMSASVKQNGDWKDHIDFTEGGLPLRSLNVKVDNGNVLNAVKFKLLLPETRNNLNEVLGSVILRELGFIAPETFQVNVNVNGVSSMMLFQEDAQKELLERNYRREGPIFEGDESLLWSFEDFDLFELYSY